MLFNEKSNQPISLNDTKSMYNNLNGEIKQLINILGYECENIQFDRNNLDEMFYKDQYHRLAEKLEEIENRLSYLQKPVLEEGYIRQNESGRYELPSGTYLTSGNVCEILVNDIKLNEKHWQYTTIEHNGKDYYAVSLGKDININGMLIRIR